MTAHRLERPLRDGRMEVSPVLLPAETDDAGIVLCEAHQVSRQPSGSTHENNQEPGGKRVERTGMPGAPGLKRPPNRRDDIE